MVDAPTFDETCDLLGIAEVHRPHCRPEAPIPGKLAVARGVLPIPPRDLLHLQFLLLGDKDKRVKRAAAKALRTVPADRLDPLLDDHSHPNLLEFLAYKRTGDEALMERIVLLRQINDKTICYLAEVGSPRVVEIISNNQERLLISPQILRFLRRNENSAQSLLDKVETFHRIYDIDVSRETPEEIEASRQARSGKPRVTDPALAPAEAPEQAEEPTGHTRAEAGGEGASAEGPPSGPDNLPADFTEGEVYIPPPADDFEVVEGLENPLLALFADWGIAADPAHLAPPPLVDMAGPPIMSDPSVQRDEVALEVDLTGLSSLADSEFEFDISSGGGGDDFGALLTGDNQSENVDDDLIANIQLMINGLTIGHKIKLAYKGNKEVREILIKERNKMVASAVVKSGRMTDHELLSAAKNRSINEEVIRLIAADPEAMRNYQIRVAIANNPKAPVPLALRLVKALQNNDLKTLAKNRNVSRTVFTAANKLFKQRKSGRG